MGLYTGQKLISFTTPYLPTLQIQGLRNGKAAPFPVTNASWNLASFRFPRTGSFKKIVVLVQEPGMLTQRVKDGLAADLCNRLNSHGVRVNKPPTTETHTARDSFDDTLKGREKEDCVVVVFPQENNNEDNYAMIKRLAELKHGTHTVCLVGSKVQERATAGNNGYMQYLSNVAMKFNMKAGGINHHVSFSKELTCKEIVVLGADVTHPGMTQPICAPVSLFYT